MDEDRHPARVLVVDDNEEFSKALKRLLADEFDEVGI